MLLTIARSDRIFPPQIDGLAAQVHKGSQGERNPQVVVVGCKDGSGAEHAHVATAHR